MNYTKLKKEKLELEYDIKKIDNILDGNENLERYIELVENDKLEVPSGLNTKILEKINDIQYKNGDIDIKNDTNIVKLQLDKKENDNIKDSKQKDKFIKRIKYKFTDILKIAACTVFALMIWEITPANTTYAKKTSEVVTEQKEKDVKNDFNLKRKVNDFFMSPIKFERREK